ncbi:segregation/condensation protein A, partial [Candidatus Uhrbacteria bacterium]|nr:segregation/condensation protein A [Candidatus Uhrbacteria bacterium]
MYSFKLEKFEGPLDLLLNLIEEEKFNISEISLSHVTDDFLQYIETHPQISPEELADFLVVATKLLLLKSKLLV